MGDYKLIGQRAEPNNRDFEEELGGWVGKKDDEIILLETLGCLKIWAFLWFCLIQMPNKFQVAIIIAIRIQWNVTMIQIVPLDHPPISTPLCFFISMQ